MTRATRHRRGATLAALLALAVCGCKSPAEHRAEADREAYELVRSRRERLALPDGPFTIEPDPERLDQRIRRGELSDLGTLALVDVLEIAAANSREYQTQKETLYLAALDLTLERWRFALQKGGTLGAALDGAGSDAERASADAGFSLSKLLGSGALIVADIGLGVSRNLLTSDGWGAVTDVGLSFSQPLLAGAGEKIVMEPLTQAERDLVYSVRGFERYRRTFAYDVATRFYRLLQTADQVKNQEENVRNLEVLSARNRALVEAGRLSVIELGQARQDELRSTNNLLDARARYERQLDEFAIFLGLPVGVRFDIDTGGMLELPDEASPQPGIEEELATRIALAARLDYLTTIEREEDARRKVEVAEDALQGFLSVNGDIRAFSTEGQPLEFDQTLWGVGLDFSFPFERLPQRNAWREAIVRREAALRAVDAASDRIRADVREDLRQTVTQLEGWRIQANAVQLADRRIESTRLQLDAGRATTRDLLEAQESLLSAQNSATASRIDYTLSRMGLYLDMELLRVDETGIRLLDPSAVEGE
ncbi:MAG: TolC family protein [Planctomycetes bacterium]|nr:TolC family protein [Planctomycetota bacterium]